MADNDANDVNNWFTSAISNENNYIEVFPFKEFKNVKYSGETEGRFSRVASSEWPCTNRKVALKKLKNYDRTRFQWEVKMHFSCHMSKNIVRFLGLTQETPSQTIENFIMVMEFADKNNLRSFLQGDITLSWDHKIKLSLDIAKGLGYIHFRDMAHRDLHSNNIVISQIHPCARLEYIAKITDFGTAIPIMNMDDDVSAVVGQIPFTDPKFLNDLNGYKKDRRSDIYSLGVIFWEISSNTVPFDSFMPGSRGDYRDLCLTMEIICGLREDDILHTPDDYSKLYKSCWAHDESKRPKIDDAIDSLNRIISGRQQQDIIGQEL